MLIAESFWWRGIPVIGLPDGSRTRRKGLRSVPGPAALQPPDAAGQVFRRHEVIEAELSNPTAHRLQPLSIPTIEPPNYWRKLLIRAPSGQSGANPLVSNEITIAATAAEPRTKTTVDTSAKTRS